MNSFFEPSVDLREEIAKEDAGLIGELGQTNLFLEFFQALRVFFAQGEAGSLFVDVFEFGLQNRLEFLVVLLGFDFGVGTGGFEGFL